MQYLDRYEINFGGLNEGKHEFEFNLEKKLFELFNYDEFNSCKIFVKVKLIKKSNLLELSLYCEGTINLNCHISNESFDYPHKSNMNFAVKFGPEFNNDNEELLVLSKGSNQLNISQQLYEMIVLSLPIKIVHPGIVDGTLKSEVLTRLEVFQSNFNKKTNSKTDPRWEKLKELKELK